MKAVASSIMFLACMVGMLDIGPKHFGEYSQGAQALSAFTCLFWFGAAGYFILFHKERTSPALQAMSPGMGHTM